METKFFPVKQLKPFICKYFYFFSICVKATAVIWCKPMTYEEFKRNVRAADLSIVEFAALMQMPHRQAITNYSKVGFVPDHMAVIVLLMVALTDAGGDVRAVLGGMDMKRKKGRGAGFEKADK